MLKSTEKQNRSDVFQYLYYNEYTYITYLYIYKKTGSIIIGERKEQNTIKERETKQKRCVPLQAKFFLL